MLIFNVSDVHYSCVSNIYYFCFNVYYYFVSNVHYSCVLFIIPEHVCFYFHYFCVSSAYLHV